MSNFRAMTRATEYGLANGIPERYRDWQPAVWINYPGGYIVIFDDEHDYLVKWNNLKKIGNRFECDEQMPLPEEKDENS